MADRDGRVVVFGATGYTGRRTAQALVDRGLRPVLAGRDTERLGKLAETLGDGLETRHADATDPASLRGLVSRDDVLISTVGPFLRRGRPAVDAVIEAGATYLDSTGEPPFVRAVFERAATLAQRTGATLIPAFGFDYVPGNLAGALAVRGTEATRVDVGYYADGDILRGSSRGTRASLLGVLLESSFAFRDGRITSDPPVQPVEVEVDGQRRAALPVGGSENFGLPRLHPGLREVNVGLGALMGGSAGIGPTARAGAVLGRVPGARAVMSAVSEALAGRPDDPEPDRSVVAAEIVAVATDHGGRTVGEAAVHLDDIYDFTARALAWAAERCLSADLASGALAPVEAFGLPELARGCREAGLTVVTGAVPD